MAEAGRMAPAMSRYDVRLRREITHRRLVISLARRTARVVSLHLLDAMLVGSAVLLTATYWHPPVPAEQYLPAVVTIFLLSLNALSAYGPGGGRRDRKRLASGVVLAALILACLTIFAPHLPLTEPFIVAAAIAAFVALTCGRKAVDVAMREVYARGIGLRRAVVIGSLDEVGRAIHSVRFDNGGDQFVVGHLAPNDLDDPTALGVLEDLPRVLEQMNVEEVVVATALATDKIEAVAAHCFERGVTLLVVASAPTAPGCWAEPTRVGGCAMLRMHPTRLQFPALMAKRVVDVVCAGLALLVLSPLIALIAVTISLDSPGPVFFRQRRVGLGGEFFRMWKFRSMAVDAEQREMELAHLNIYGNGTFKLRHDPRITRVGKLLRRTSMDELPQLINVIWGDMSIVGPRPALVNDIARYQPHHFARLTVVPGITGPWQVGGRNLITDFEAIIEMERAYISGWSLLVDLKIMLRTFSVVVRGEGAY